MRVFVTGATGFVGRALVLRLRRDGHHPVAWVRDLARGGALLGTEAELIAAADGDAAAVQAMSQCEAVVHLAGESVMQGRWTAARKQALVDSRVGLAERLVRWLEQASPRPRVLLSASAVGYYGDRQSDVLDESARPATDFLAELCVKWEAAARRAEGLGVRVVLPRIGLVLGNEGGMLAKLLPLFEAGLGGPMGTGQQYMPWIHLHDLVESMVAALAHDHWSGPYNAVAPEPVTNRVLTTALAQQCAVSANAWVPTPILRVALGEAANAVTASQRVVPSTLGQWGFRFAHPQIDTALADLLDSQAVHITSVQSGGTAPMPISTSDYWQRRRSRYVLDAQCTLPASRPAVFDFFSRAENLGLMTPMAMQLRRVSAAQPMAVGTTIDYTLRVGSIPARWRTRIAHWDPGVCFIDTQEAGPYHAWWHEHRFNDAGDGTIMTDRVFYAPPFGSLGALANVMVVKRQLRRIFWHRRSAITLRYGRSA